MGGRAPLRCAAVAACGDESGGKICGRFAQDLVGLSQLAHFAFQAFIFSACSVLMPPRSPRSTSTFLTYSFSVCGAQPIFDEIDTIAAQRLSCCHAPSKTIRTARSRTSGEDLFVVLLMMLHPTHELEPPANPVRFSLGLWPLTLKPFLEQDQQIRSSVIAVRHNWTAPIAHLSAIRGRHPRQGSA